MKTFLLLSGLLFIPLSIAIADNLTMLENKIHSIGPELYFYPAFGLKVTIRNLPALQAFIEKECLGETGFLTVNEMHSVNHDWYDREKEIIGTYRLQ